jgi:elongation factor G
MPKFYQRGNIMKVYSSDAIRNVALIGHSGEGKTSLAEAILFNAKAIDRLGRVDDGNSTMDYDAEEINRKISIGLGIGYAEWKGTKLNVLDTPGFFDFVGEVVSALTVADGAVIVTKIGRAHV